MASLLLLSALASALSLVPVSLWVSVELCVPVPGWLLFSSLVLLLLSVLPWKSKCWWSLWPQWGMQNDGDILEEHEQARRLPALALSS